MVKPCQKHVANVANPIFQASLRRNRWHLGPRALPLLHPGSKRLCRWPPKVSAYDLGHWATGPGSGRSGGKETTRNTQITNHSMQPISAKHVSGLGVSAVSVIFLDALLTLYTSSPQ